MTTVQATEITYELHSLGWKAFQNLCSTIVAEIWGQTIQTFFDSHDGGRDGAFYGEWVASSSELYSGSFTVQCKFTKKADALVKMSNLADEFKKAERLAKKGLADNYFLFTNAKLTGSNEEKIRSKFESIPELKKFSLYGQERVCQIILEFSKLRMLVPRIYGLGDLSQILDVRAYDQTQEILSSLGEDLSKFIITEPFRDSAKALLEHGFVLLLGEAMCGKSTIAAALAMGALDKWGCSTIKVRDADDFVKHFNPHEKQLFWVDDAFGPTQIDWSSAINWSKTFPHVSAAIHKGAKIIFTSRDYIYKSARRYLKESALPVIKESQVVIHVENLTKDEREQILYNHIRLGTQKKHYKQKLKPFLPDVALHKKFSPEIARRLGNPLFTKDLSISKYGLDNFVEKPLEMLCEIINTMDDPSRSALALVFIRGGSLPSPLSITPEEEHAIARLGGTVGDAMKGLDSLNGSLLLNSKNLAVIIPDSGFLRKNVRALMSSDEISDILRSVQCSLLPNLEDTIDSWEKDYDREEEPEAYFVELKSVLDDYKSEFEEDAESRKQINEAIQTIDQVIEDLKSEYTPSDDENFWNKNVTKSPTQSDSRSIFDDVDA